MTTPTPDAGEIKRQVMSDAIGTVCEIEGAVHVHLPMNANDMERTTAGVLIEVAQERIRQRVKWGDDHDDEHTLESWDRLHRRRLGRTYRFGEDLSVIVSDRTQLVRAIAVLVAHVEALDRQAERECSSGE